MERYTQDGIINGTKDELVIFDDGTIQYVIVNANGENIVFNNCELYPVGNKGGMRIKYGGCSVSFKQYDTGEIDKKWIIEKE
jgi:hypothetical protein